MALLRRLFSMFGRGSRTTTTTPPTTTTGVARSGGGGLLGKLRRMVR